MVDTPKSAAPKKNPLDILEDILDNAEAQKADNKEKEAEAQVLAEIKAKEEEALVRDKANLEVERDKMSAIGESSQEQARLSQIKEKQEKHQEKVEQSQGFEIRQIGHKKI